MKIKAVRIRSYKGIADSNWIELSPHVTVLVGQNNAGKTAFLECLETRSLVSHPHRSPILGKGEGIRQTEVGFQVEVTGAETTRQAIANGCLVSQRRTLSHRFRLHATQIAQTLPYQGVILLWLICQTRFS